eukprot:3880749-Lingulodinium_polyedra.AAC.1
MGRDTTSKPSPGVNQGTFGGRNARYTRKRTSGLATTRFVPLHVAMITILGRVVRPEKCCIEKCAGQRLI